MLAAPPAITSRASRPHPRNWLAQGDRTHIKVKIRRNDAATGSTPASKARVAKSGLRPNPIAETITAHGASRRARPAVDAEAGGSSSGEMGRRQFTLQVSDHSFPLSGASFALV